MLIYTSLVRFGREKPVVYSSEKNIVLSTIEGPHKHNAYIFNENDWKKLNYTVEMLFYIEKRNTLS